MTQTTLRRQRIVLDITYAQREGVTAPNTWDWSSLLDLDADERAVVVCSSEVVGSDTTPSNPVHADSPLQHVTDDEYRVSDNASFWVEATPCATSLHVVVRDGEVTVSAYPLGDEMAEAIETFSVDASAFAS